MSRSTALVPAVAGLPPAACASAPPRRAILERQAGDTERASQAPSVNT